MSKGINPNLQIKTRPLRSLSYYLDGLASGDRYVLSEVLTLVESLHQERRLLGEQILAELKINTRTIRIGITGSPGAGKSTFIEALGTMLADKGHKVAVLAVDPSSTRSHGSILGDKTRMSALSTHANAFVRPTASANMLGGVARATKESITLCEAAGYEIILVESVGVGQSETDRLFHHELQGWQVPVALCSAIERKGIEEVWATIEDFLKKSKKSGFFQEKRIRQDQQWIKSQIKIELMDKAEELFGVDQHLNDSSESQTIFETLQSVRTNI